MKFRLTSRTPALFAAVIAAPLALAACSDSDDAAYESDTATEWSKKERTIDA